MPLEPQQRPALDAYITDLYAPEDAALRFARAEAQRQGLPDIHIQPADGRLLALLVQISGARRIVEIGTLAGYSGLWMARALPSDGMLYTLEIDPQHAAVARQTFAHGGVSGRTQILVGPALGGLHALSGGRPYDMVFIDADKTGYPAYLAWAIDHLRPGGVIAAHNALREGRILDPQTDADVQMHRFNQMIAQDARLDATILNMGDGMLVAVRRPV